MHLKLIHRSNREFTYTVDGVAPEMKAVGFSLEVDLSSKVFRITRLVTDANGKPVYNEAEEAVTETLVYPVDDITLEMETI